MLSTEQIAQHGFVVKVYVPEIGESCVVCTRCKKPALFLYRAHSLYHPYIPVGGLCRSCTFRAERDFIKGLPLEELPLYLTFQWILHPLHRELLESRLDGTYSPPVGTYKPLH